ncbi:MAG: hypothetical protein JST00_37515 [Deltaproteobacteria bacterium]|nr:hypothetical protein [Deltaproteobacteria bacterium]
MRNQPLSVITFALVASMAVGCSSEPADVVVPAPVAGEAIPSLHDSSPEDDAQGAPASSGNDTVDKRTDGAPEMTKVTYFGLPNDGGFPVYLSHLLGTKFHLFPSVEIKNPAATPQTVVLRGSLQGYTKAEAVATITIQPGQTAKGYFDATLDFAALGPITSQVSANYHISLETTDGKILNARTKVMKLLPKNTVLWKGVFAGSTGLTEKQAVIGVMTTPHDGKLRVDTLLKEAASYSKYNAMIGYQYHKPTSTVQDDVSGANDQVGAVYKALKARGFNYSSVSEAFFTNAQNIRYPAESLAVATANCIDGSLVFASVLEALDMDPFVVFVPGHAFVGVRVGPAGSEAAKSSLLVETTMLGTADYPAATARGKEEFIQYVNAKTATVIDVKAMRTKGFLPSPFPM